MTTPVSQSHNCVEEEDSALSQIWARSLDMVWPSETAPPWKPQDQSYQPKQRRKKRAAEWAAQILQLLYLTRPPGTRTPGHLRNCVGHLQSSFKPRETAEEQFGGTNVELFSLTSEGVYIRFMDHPGDWDSSESGFAHFYNFLSL